MNKAADGKDWKKHWGLAGDRGLGFERVAVASYTSRDVFDAEREKIFRKVWLAVGREGEVPNPGDYIKREIYPLQTEALIVRGNDGKVRAFHNACRHRGTAIVSDRQGTANVFVCPYHAWSYGTDGKLRSMPGAEYFPQVDRKTVGLTPIHLEIWNGFIFLNFDEQPEQTLTEYLGAFATLFGDVPFGAHPHIIEMTMDIDANWKTLVEASNEGYHVSTLHRWTLGEQIMTPGNPMNNFYDPIFSPPHATATAQANHEWRPHHPVVQFVYATEAFKAQPGGAQGQDAAAGGANSFAAHKAINRVGLPAFAVESTTLFPCTVLQILTNRYIWLQYWPVAPDRTRFVFRLFSQVAPSSYREAFAEAHMIAYSRDIATEDSCMTSRQQRGFKGGGLSEVVLGENECMLRYFHKMVQQYLTKNRGAG